MKYAPIALFVYNRPEQTRAVVEALAKNMLASSSQLTIYSDAPKNKESEPAVKKVRAYLKTIKGFRRVIIVKRKTNLGLAKSFISGITEQVKKHGKIIVVEDDNLTSKYFLKFMNDGLLKYADNKKVASIHGYMYPVEGKLPETFFLKGADSWGWATWDRAWAHFTEDGNLLLSELRRKKLTRDFDINGSYGFTKMLEGQVKGKNNSWSVRWSASVFLKDMLTLYPGRSLVKNIGFDGSGVHCKPTNVFDTQLSKSPVKLLEIPVKEDVRVKKQLASYYRKLKYRVALQGVLGLLNRRMGVGK